MAMAIHLNSDRYQPSKEKNLFALIQVDQELNLRDLHLAMEMTDTIHQYLLYNYPHMDQYSNVANVDTHVLM